MQSAGQWILMLVLVFSLIGAVSPMPVQAAEASAGSEPLLQSSTLQMVSPSNCPPGGCAAGQRLSMRFDFFPTGFPVSPDPNVPNVKVCVFVPSGWNVAPDLASKYAGEDTGVEYSPDPAPSCTQNGYIPIVEHVAKLPSGTFVDALNFSFRIGSNGTGSGRVLAQWFVNNNGNWDMINRATSSTLSIIAAATPAYVANDVADCGSNSPCYVNSADDLPDGIGTGLKDAVDATPVPGTVIVVGTYTIKSQTVQIDRPVVLTGAGNATITYNGPGPCDQAMLILNNETVSAPNEVTISGLNITDGFCNGPNRNLIEVNTPSPAIIVSNDLVGGDNAIVIKDNEGPVSVSYNDIRGNAGFAVFAEGSSKNGALDITANNFIDNRAGSAVECSASSNRRVNHNYWSGGAPTADESHCTLAQGKRLGMPIAVKANAPGVDAHAVLVTDTKTYAFNNQIAYSRTGGADFYLYIINHGYATAGGPPFTYALGGESPSPCSNYWDIYLPPSEAVGGTLELFFKYDKTSGCLAAINSSLYCDQTSDTGKYPLYWYDPVNNATTWWDKTALRPENLSSGNGQTTQCHVDQNEIQISIDGTGRPDLTTDLGYTPFMVGVPVIRSFQPLAINQAVNVTWITNNEPDIEGFYVLRSNDGINFTPISDLILHTGTALVGKSYSHSDTGRSNGVNYYYRLQVVRTDGASIYSSIVSIKPNIPTITPTATRFLTLTRTIVYATATRTFTRVSYLQPTRNLTPIPTLRGRTPSPTFLVLATRTPAFDTGTPDPFADTPIPGSYPASGEGGPEEANLTPGSGTPVAVVNSGTPGPTSSPELPGTVAGESTTTTNPWISLFLGVLTGLAATAGLGGWWYYSRLKH